MSMEMIEQILRDGVSIRTGAELPLEIGPLSALNDAALEKLLDLVMQEHLLRASDPASTWMKKASEFAESYIDKDSAVLANHYQNPSKLRIKEELADKLEEVRRNREMYKQWYEIVQLDSPE